MQLIPKQLIGIIGGAYLKNSKYVLFHPQNCEALESFTKVMSSGFVSLSLSLLILWPFVTESWKVKQTEMNEFLVIEHEKSASLLSGNGVA